MEYQFLIQGLLFLAIIVLFWTRLVSTPKKEVQPRYLYRGKSTILTRSEADLYKKLTRVFPNYIIVPQVHLSAILDHKVYGQNWRGAFTHINGKSVDFVFLDVETLCIAFALELDDYTHNRPERIARDKEVNAIFKNAGVSLVRLRNTLNKTSHQIKIEIKKSLDNL